MVVATNRDVPFEAVISDVRIFVTLLKPIQISDIAVLSISEAGLTFTTEKSGNVQANAYVPCALFSSFRYTQPIRRKPPPLVSPRQPGSVAPSESTTSGSLNPPPGPSSAALARAEREAAALLGSPILVPMDEDDDDDGEHSIEFEVSLVHFLEVLNMFGTAAPISKGAQTKALEMGDARRRVGTAYMDEGGGGKRGRSPERNTTSAALSYNHNTKELEIILHEDESEMTCKLRTFVASSLLGLDFENDLKVAEAQTKSDPIAELLQTVDGASESLEVLFSRNYDSTATEARAGRGMSRLGTDAASEIEGSRSGSTVPSRRTGRKHAGVEMFKLSVNGQTGNAELEIPNERHLMLQFRCDYDVERSYPFKTFGLCFKALQTSTWASVRIDSHGLLNLQCLMPKGTGTLVGVEGQDRVTKQFGIIEFTFMPHPEPGETKPEADDDDSEDESAAKQEREQDEEEEEEEEED